MGTIKNVLFWFACGLVVVSAIRIIGPQLETQFWPVYSKFEIVSLEVVDETHTRAVFKFTKNRNCVSRGAVWANGELGQQVNVIFEPSPARMPRPMGEQLSRPYLFEATPEDLNNNLVATIISRCPLIPWDSRSDVYP
jgi:hypothetical protein